MLLKFQWSTFSLKTCRYRWSFYLIPIFIFAFCQGINFPPPARVSHSYSAFVFPFMARMTPGSIGRIHCAYGDILTSLVVPGMDCATSQGQPGIAVETIWNTSHGDIAVSQLSLLWRISLNEFATVLEKVFNHKELCEGIRCVVCYGCELYLKQRFCQRL